MGTIEGGIYFFDPIIRGRQTVHTFNTNYESPLNKNRSVDLVKWCEPSPSSKNATRFIVVFDDGTMHFYSKDLPLDRSDNEKEMIQVKPDQ